MKEMRLNSSPSAFARVLHESVFAREDESVDELLLPDDDLAHLFAYLRHELLLRGDPVRCFLQVHFISPCGVKVEKLKG